MKNVLFLCTGNSCRSIMAEGILNHYGKGKFKAFSAGSFPSGKVHPKSLETLNRHGMKSLGFESKSWDVFKGLVELDIVITVCDNADGEVCPAFMGTPLKAHWGAPDPAHFEGTETDVNAEFDRLFGILERRIKALVALPEDRATNAEELSKIGKIV